MYLRACRDYQDHTRDTGLGHFLPENYHGNDRRQHYPHTAEYRIRDAQIDHQDGSGKKHIAESEKQHAGYLN